MYILAKVGLCAEILELLSYRTYLEISMKISLRLFDKIEC